MPNSKSDSPIKTYAVSIDHIEQLTGIDLFAPLPDKQEDKLESSITISAWDFSSSNSKVTHTKKNR